MMREVFPVALCARSDVEWVMIPPGPTWWVMLSFWRRVPRALPFAWGVPALGVHHMRGIAGPECRSVPATSSPLSRHWGVPAVIPNWYVLDGMASIQNACESGLCAGEASTRTCKPELGLALSGWAPSSIAPRLSASGYRTGRFRVPRPHDRQGPNLDSAQRSKTA